MHVVTANKAPLALHWKELFSLAAQQGLQIRYGTAASAGLPTLEITGDGCAISQASVDIMLDLVIGKTKEEAMHLADLFFRMIKGTVSDEELEELEEASALVDISHMPARVKCAVLGWHTLTEMLGDEPEEK